MAAHCFGWTAGVWHLTGHGYLGLQVLVPCNLSAGLLYLEVQRGSFLGPALPVLVAPTAALAAEAACMLQATLPADQQGLTVDLGCAMLRLSGCNKQSRYA